MVQNYAPLLEAIETATQHADFKALTPEQQVAFVDIADTLKEECAKAQPDAGKVKRWSTRLLEFSSNVGMTAGTAAIGQVLAKIFVG
jgi:hypothetical protein